MKDTMDKDITILAIESSCDETAAAVVADGNSAVGVSACGLLEGLKKASFGSDL